MNHAKLYGEHWITRSSRRTRLLVALLIAGWLGAILLVAGCTDGQDAADIAQAEQVAHDKKVALLSMPCTWIAQCSHEPCPVVTRRCVPADLRSEK